MKCLIVLEARYYAGVGNVSSGLPEAFAGVVSIFVVDCIGPVTVNGR